MSELKVGLIGAHISRSRLKAGLEILCAEIGWTLDYEVADSALITDFDFDTTVARMRDAGRRGVTVTHPWKRAARRFVGDGMLPALAHLGATNTLVFDDTTRGFNTDYTGFTGVLDDASRTALGDVVMMGAGGVAEALAPAVAERLCDGAVLQVFDTDKTRAADLCGRSPDKARVLPQADIAQAVQNAEGLINATPMGMVEYPGQAFDAAHFSALNQWAFDAVYTPTDTAFLCSAADAGISCLTGFDLFRHMARHSFAAYTGHDIPVADAMRLLAPLKP